MHTCPSVWLVLVGFGPSTISSWDQGAMVELLPHSKGGQAEGEAAVIAHQPASQGIEPETTEPVDQEESPEPPASLLHSGGPQMRFSGVLPFPHCCASSCGNIGCVAMELRY